MGEPHTYELFLGLTIIWTGAQLFGTLATKVKQPRVFGELLSGVLLGPTVWSPAGTEKMFPPGSQPLVVAIGELGLSMFALGIGIRFDRVVLKGKYTKITLISLASVALPLIFCFPLGTLLIYMDAGFQSDNPGSYISFVITLASGLAVTALPVAAAIIQEMGMTYTPFGLVNIGMCGQVTFYYLVLLGLSKGMVANELPMFALKFGLLIVLMLLMEPIRIIWTRCGKSVEHAQTQEGDAVNGNPEGKAKYEEIGNGDQQTHSHETSLKKSRSKFDLSFLSNGYHPATISLNAILFILAAVATERLGFTFVMGPFVYGISGVPFDKEFRKQLFEPYDEIGKRLFLPVFFALAGLKTNMRLITAQQVPGIIAILAFGTVSKLLATIPARLVGFNWRDALFLGVLSNCRGFIVLVVALEGQRVGLFGEPVFFAFVILALVSTVMTGPLCNKLRPETVEGDTHQPGDSKTDVNSKGDVAVVPAVSLNGMI